jgi:hypothetical protein
VLIGLPLGAMWADYRFWRRWRRMIVRPHIVNVAPPTTAEIQL